MLAYVNINIVPRAICETFPPLPCYVSQSIADILFSFMDARETGTGNHVVGEPFKDAALILPRGRLSEELALSFDFERITMWNKYSLYSVSTYVLRLWKIDI